MCHAEDEQKPYEPGRRELEEMDELRSQMEQELKNKGKRT